MVLQSSLAGIGNLLLKWLFIDEMAKKLIFDFKGGNALLLLLNTTGSRLSHEIFPSHGFGLVESSSSPSSSQFCFTHLVSLGCSISAVQSILLKDSGESRISNCSLIYEHLSVLFILPKIYSAKGNILMDKFRRISFYRTRGIETLFNFPSFRK